MVLFFSVMYLSVCQPGFYGENCLSKCHCAVDGCDTITGECSDQTAGCKVPWTGRKCATRKVFELPNCQAVKLLFILC